MSESKLETGLPMLNAEIISPVIEKTLQAKHFEICSVPDTKIFGLEGSEIRYAIKGHIIVVTSVTACDGPAGDRAEHTYAETRSKLQEHLKQNLANYHVIMPLMGQGLTEKHFTTLYQAPGKTPILFDPKAGSGSVFFSQPSLLRKVFNIIRGFFGSILNQDGVEVEIPSADKESKQEAPEAKSHPSTIHYTSLGTQSFFDGVTCGYHMIANVYSMVELIEKGDEVTKENLLNHENDPVRTGIGLVHHYGNMPIRHDLADFVKEAWDKMLGKKESALWRIPRFPEFIAALPAAFANWMRHRCFLWSPDNSFIQLLRSVVLAVSSAFYLVLSPLRTLVRLVTSPITSYREAKEKQHGRLKHFPLGYLSLFASCVAYSALLIFALPILWPAAGALIVGSMAWALAYMGAEILFNSAMISLMTLSVSGFLLIAGSGKISDVWADCCPPSKPEKPDPSNSVSGKGYRDMREGMPGDGERQDAKQEEDSSKKLQTKTPPLSIHFRPEGSHVRDEGRIPEQPVSSDMNAGSATL